MSPQEALQLLDLVTSLVPLKRQEQIAVMQALNALKQAIEKPEEKKSK